MRGFRAAMTGATRNRTQQTETLMQTEQRNENQQENGSSSVCWIWDFCGKNVMRGDRVW